MPRTAGSTRLELETLEAREVPAPVFAINAPGRLLTFDSSNPSVILSGVTIRGLSTPGELILDLDVRPGSGLLYGRSTADRLYLINPFTGFATPIGGIFRTTSLAHGMDFDPTTDQLRVVSNARENLAFNPNFGSVAAIGQPLSYLSTDFAAGLAPRVTGLGFTNSLPFALTTTGYGIDHARNTLVRFVGPLNAGRLVTVGSLGLDVTSLVGFDIPAGSAFGFATLRRPGSTVSLFAPVNLATGRAAPFSLIGNGQIIRDIAVLGGVFPTIGSFLSPTSTITGFNTSPLFPTLTQPLNPGLVSSGFGIFGSNVSFTSGFDFTTGGSTFTQPSLF